MINEFSAHPQKMMYPYNTYRAFCIDVYDGDTYTMMVDLGFYTYTTIRVRVKTIDTPEIKTKDPVEKALGIKSRDRARELLLNKPCVIATDKDTMSFDRWIADVSYFGADNTMIDVGQQLISEGLAKPFVG